MASISNNIILKILQESLNLIITLFNDLPSDYKDNFRSEIIGQTIIKFYLVCKKWSEKIIPRLVIETTIPILTFQHYDKGINMLSNIGFKNFYCHFNSNYIYVDRKSRTHLSTILKRMANNLIFGDKTSPNYLLKMVKKHQEYISKLTLQLSDDTYSFKDTYNSLDNTFSNIKELIILDDGYIFSNKKGDYLKDSKSFNFSNLEKLSIQHYEDHQDYLKVIFENGKLNNLTSLKIKIDDDDMKLDILFLSKLPKLKNIELVSDAHISHLTVQQLCNFISSISINAWVDSTFYNSLFTSLEVNSTLTSLTAGIPYNSIDSLAKLINNNKSLEYLDIGLTKDDGNIDITISVNDISNQSLTFIKLNNDNDPSLKADSLILNWNHMIKSNVNHLDIGRPFELLDRNTNSDLIIRNLNCSFPNLDSISFKFDMAHVHQIESFLFAHPKLLNLILFQENKGLGSSYINIIKSHLNLKSLTLVNVIHIEEIIHFLNMNHPTITEFVCNVQSPPKVKIISQLAPLITQNTTLRKLKIEFNEKDEISVETVLPMITSIINYNRTLTTLIIPFYCEQYQTFPLDLTSKTIERFKKSIKINSNLLQLVLTPSHHFLDTIIPLLKSQNIRYY